VVASLGKQLALVRFDVVVGGGVDVPGDAGKEDEEQELFERRGGHVCERVAETEGSHCFCWMSGFDR